MNTGANAFLRIETWLAGQDNINNWVDIGWRLTFGERSDGTSGWAGSVSASVAVATDGGGGQIWAGSFGFDFRPGGVQSVTVAQGTYRHTNYADGVPRNITFTGYNGDTGTSTGGSGASVSETFAPPTTKLAPSTPYNVSASRVNSNQIYVAWDQVGIPKLMKFSTRLTDLLGKASFQSLPMAALR